jgi:hypothetical protein
MKDSGNFHLAAQLMDLNGWEAAQLAVYIGIHPE